MSGPQAQDLSAIQRPDRVLLTLYLLRCLLTGPGFLVTFPYCWFKFHTLRYRFDDEGVTMSWGILWRHEIFLTYARIQDIHLSSGVLERWLGLATIHLQTAAGSAGADMAIVGLTQFEMVRDSLYLRTRGARPGDGREAPAGGAPAAGGDDAVLALLTEIRDEVRGLREAAVAPKAGRVVIYEPIKGTLMRLLRAPQRPPEPPPGGSGVVEIFRAAPSFLKLRVILWGWSLGSAIVGELVGLYFFHFFDKWVGAAVVWTLIALTLLGLVAKYFLIRLDYDTRYYVVGDRSLRIREGALTIHEITLTYANVQNLSITQGPLERLLGIANLVVETAGGAGSGGRGDRDSSFRGGHEGVLRGVANVTAVRDRIQALLRQFRDAGLGDPEDRAGVAVARGLSPAALDRLREIRDDLRAMRQE